MLELLSISLFLLITLVWCALSLLIAGTLLKTHFFSLTIWCTLGVYILLSISILSFTWGVIANSLFSFFFFL